MGEKGSMKPMDYHYLQLAAIQPNPELTPEQVVKTQLEGLQNNDLSRDNTGIRICFNFASPATTLSLARLGILSSCLKRPLMTYSLVSNGLNLARWW